MTELILAIAALGLGKKIGMDQPNKTQMRWLIEMVKHIVTRAKSLGNPKIEHDDATVSLKWPLNGREHHLMSYLPLRPLPNSPC